MALGIGPLAEQPVALAGRYGGGLSRVAGDGWSLVVETLDWPNDCVFLEPPSGSIDRAETAVGCVKLSDWDPVLAAGFSHTGRSFVIAQSHGMDIFSRPSG